MADGMIDPTERFSERAAHYVLGRPSYPPEAIDALFEGFGDPLRAYATDENEARRADGRLA